MRTSNHTTSQNTNIDYKCDICKDTGWVLGENGYIRCRCFEKEHMQRLWKAFGVDPKEVKKLKDYKPYDDLTTKAKNKAAEYIKNFNSIKLQPKNGFGLFGQPGAGKSHIIIAIGAALLDKGISVVYMPYLEATRQLKANANEDEYYLNLSNRYQRARVLIIDDLFKDKVKMGQLISQLTEADIKHIYPILNYRYINKMPTLISSECTPAMLLNLDEALAGRILESCGDNIVIFRDSKYDYRFKNFKKADT